MAVLMVLAYRISLKYRTGPNNALGDMARGRLSEAPSFVWMVKYSEPLLESSSVHQYNFQSFQYLRDPIL